MFRKIETAEIEAYVTTYQIVNLGFIVNIYGNKGNGKTYTVTQTLINNKDTHTYYVDVLTDHTPFKILNAIYNQMFNKNKSMVGSNETKLTEAIINHGYNETIIILDNMETFKKYETKGEGGGGLS